MARATNVRTYIKERGGYYHIAVTYYDEAKKRRSTTEGTGIPIAGNNRRAAEAARREVKKAFEQKYTGKEETKLLFSDYLEMWVVKTKTTRADSTQYEYEKAVKNIISPYFKKAGVKLGDLTNRHIQDFYDHRQTAGGVSAATIHRHHAIISKSLKYAVKLGYLAYNPLAQGIELPKAQQHIADYYSQAELKELLQAVKGQSLEVVILLASWFGLRRGEIIGLRWDAVDLEAGVLSVVGVVRGKGGGSQQSRDLYYVATAKRSASIRSFPMPEAAVTYLQKLKKAQDARKGTPGYNHRWDDFVCVRENGDIIPLEYVTRRFPKICEQCGLRRLKLHELRHTNISLLLEEGASMKDLQEWAGHSSYSTTANIYSHVQYQAKKKLSEKIDKITG